MCVCVCWLCLWHSKIWRIYVIGIGYFIMIVIADLISERVNFVCSPLRLYSHSYRQIFFTHGADLLSLCFVFEFNSSLARIKANTLFFWFICFVSVVSIDIFIRLWAQGIVKWAKWICTCFFRLLLRSCALYSRILYMEIVNFRHKK